MGGVWYDPEDLPNWSSAELLDLVSKPATWYDEATREAAQAILANRGEITVNVMDEERGIITLTLPDDPTGTYADGAMAGVVAYLNATRNEVTR